MGDGLDGKSRVHTTLLHPILWRCLFHFTSLNFPFSPRNPSLLSSLSCSSPLPPPSPQAAVRPPHSLLLQRAAGRSLRWRKAGGEVRGGSGETLTVRGEGGGMSHEPLNAVHQLTARNPSLCFQLPLFPPLLPPSPLLSPLLFSSPLFSHLLPSGTAWASASESPSSSPRRPTPRATPACARRQTSPSPTAGRQITAAM